MPEILRLRPEVQRAAEAMERALRRKDDVRGDTWRGTDVDWLVERLQDEVAELEAATLNPKGDVAGRVRREAADVCNFAMFIAEVIAAAEAEETPDAHSGQ